MDHIYIYTYTFVISYLVCKCYMDLHLPPHLHGFEDSKQHLMKTCGLGILCYSCAHICAVCLGTVPSAGEGVRKVKIGAVWHAEIRNLLSKDLKFSHLCTDFSRLGTLHHRRQLWWVAPPHESGMAGGRPSFPYKDSREVCASDRENAGYGWLWMVMVSSFGDRGWCWWPFLGWWCFGA